MAERVLRILQINTERGWRGGERQTLLTAQSLRERGHDVELLLFGSGALAERARAQGLVVHTAHGGIAFGVWLALHAKRYDILHVQTAKAVAWAVATAWLHRCAVVFSRRTSFSLGMRAWLTRLKWRQVDQMVAISEAAAAAPRAMGISTKVIASAVSPTSVDTARTQNFLARHKLANRRLVGTAAALSVEKDPLTLIRAAAQVCAQFDDVVFVHWGAAGAASAQAQQLIDTLGLQERYLLLGFEPNVEQLFSALSVFVMASRFEALGSSVLDAMLQKVPVVSTDAGGLKETVAEGRGLLCAAGDHTAMAVHIASVLTQPMQAQAMVETAYAAVTTEYGVERMVDRYVQLYRTLLGEQRAPH